MELVEFQVADPAAGAPGHGDAVAAGAVRVAGVEVDLRRAAAGQHGEARAEGVDLVGGAVQHVGAQAALAGQAQLGLGDQVDGDALFEQLDVRSLPGLLQQGVEDRRAGGVGRVDDAPVAVAAFAGQVVFEAAVLGRGLLFPGEGHALVDQPLDGFAAVLDGEAHGVLAAQAGAGVEGVLDVRLDGVGIVQHGGDAALGPVGRAVGQVALAQHRDAQVRGQGEGEGQAGSPAADDQDVVLVVLVHAGAPRKSGP
ncbi:hypothetical protein D9M68_372120 [compost metagenome]